MYHVQLEATFRNLDFGQSVELASAKAQDAIKAGLKRRGIVLIPDGRP